MCKTPQHKTKYLMIKAEKQTGNYYHLFIPVSPNTPALLVIDNMLLKIQHMRETGYNLIHPPEFGFAVTCEHCDSITGVADDKGRNSSCKSCAPKHYNQELIKAEELAHKHFNTGG